MWHCFFEADWGRLGFLINHVYMLLRPCYLMRDVCEHRAYACRNGVEERKSGEFWDMYRHELTQERASKSDGRLLYGERASPQVEPGKFFSRSRVEVLTVLSRWLYQELLAGLWCPPWKPECVMLAKAGISQKLFSSWNQMLSEWEFAMLALNLSSVGVPPAGKRFFLSGLLCHCCWKTRAEAGKLLWFLGASGYRA